MHNGANTRCCALRSPMNNQPEEHHRQRVKWDATINLGHILTFIGFIVAGFGAWASLDKRIMVIEEYRALQKQVDLAQDSRVADAAMMVKDVLVRLDKQVERLNDKLDRVTEKKNP